MLSREQFEHQREKYFRYKVISGEHITEADRTEHLNYIKKYGKSSFANRWNIPMLSTKRMPQPEGKIYRDDGEFTNISKEELENLKKEILQLKQQNEKQQEKDKNLIRHNEQLTEKNNVPVYKKIFRRKR